MVLEEGEDEGDSAVEIGLDNEDYLDSLHLIICN